MSPGFHVLVQIEIAHADAIDVARRRVRIAFQRELAARFEQHRRRGEFRDAYFRTLQVGEHRHFAAEFGGGGARFVGAALVVVRRTVRHVDADDVHAFLRGCS